MNIIIIGATSAIAKAFSQLYAQKYQANFFLAARDEQSLKILADDLLVRGAQQAHSFTADFSDNSACEPLVEQAFAALGQVDLILMAHGVLGDQKIAEQDVTAMQAIMQINAISSLSLLTLMANKMEQQGSGSIAYISSVAGDRGRPSNYVYGASKAIVSTFLQGLRARLAKSGVHVLTVKPGFVDTPMTAAIEKSGPLWAQPEDIALGIERALDKRRNTVYLPWFWRGIMAIITRIPEVIFKKLSL